MPDRILLATLAVQVTMLAASCAIAPQPSTDTENKPKNALDLFSSRPIWKDLPPTFLNLLANKLGSVDKANRFAQLCEKTGILKNNIIAVVPDYSDDPSFALGLVTRTLTSYANAMGEKGELREAKHALELALLLKPRWWPAWFSMAVVAINEGDCPIAVSWTDKVLSFKPDPESKDPWERAFAAMRTPEGGKLAAEILEDPNMIRAWDQTRKDMLTIKNACK